MKKNRLMKHRVGSAATQLPVFVEKDEDGFYVVECPVLEGCYSQGKTLDEALQNVREVVQLVLRERDGQADIKAFHPQDYSIHTITV